ncbi:MAG: CvpA family protein [Alphaproteobacteria bacterium]
MSAPFTAMDVILLAIALLSGLLAMLRGFTREVLSILSWVLAAFAAFWIYPIMRTQVREFVQPDWLADIVLVGGAFVVVLISVSVLTVRLTDMILDSPIGGIDRTLGFLFGCARGVVLVVVAYLFFAWLVPLKQQPTWVKNAQSLPFMVETGDFLLSFLPEDPSELIDKLPSGLKDRLGSGGETDTAPSTQPAPVAPAPISPAEPAPTAPEQRSNLPTSPLPPVPIFKDA